MRKRVAVLLTHLDCEMNEAIEVGSGLQLFFKQAILQNLLVELLNLF
jgi:hypothetical protein